jgi:SAM-dependent methyltransferase
MARAKRRAHLDLLDRWLPDLKQRTVLKTDLWEEGVTGDELLFTLARRAGSAYGIDISRTTASSAARAAAAVGVAPRLMQADLRKLPFGDETIDAIVSTSTLDHLGEPDRIRALGEMRRVLSPTAVLVITFDNAENVGDRLLRAAAKLGMVPFPLGPSAALPDLQSLLHRTGFDCGDHAYLVYGPRVLTTVGVRTIRFLPERWSQRGVAHLWRFLDAAGGRFPSKMAAFVAVRATPATGRIGPARVEMGVGRRGGRATEAQED